ncbi:CTP synthetase [Oceaniglobus ichthyenteri]|uniref:CTP synthetase n=1 Tax=Oceaniglobus ichthyenteri TaxID=2136177 RepID=UPI000D3706D3|nr:CTP synthetase [Oceaniglobus ichthyenteri]
MFRLAANLYAIVGTSLAGIAVIAVLSMGMDGWVPIVAGAAGGFIVAIPASWYIAKKIKDNMV